ILLPATQLTAVLNIASVTAAVGRLPWLVQFFLAVVVADLAEYIIHRAFHEVPFLWGFHAIHHSSKTLHWIAGSRSPLFDDVAVRAYLLVRWLQIFAHNPGAPSLLFVPCHPTRTRRSSRATKKASEPYLIQPRYHHWHHTSQKEAIDKNYAIHFPWIDRIFGTY